MTDALPNRTSYIGYDYDYQITSPHAGSAEKFVFGFWIVGGLFLTVEDWGCWFSEKTSV